MAGEDRVTSGTRGIGSLAPIGWRMGSDPEYGRAELTARLADPAAPTLREMHLVKSLLREGANRGEARVLAWRDMPCAVQTIE